MPQSDHVTGLETRGTLETFLARSGGTATPLVVVMCDVIGLKTVNERDGFASGDTQLRTAADRLRIAASGAAMLARLGGDELVAVFTGPQASADAERTVSHLATEGLPPLRAAATVQKSGETCGQLIDRLYAIVRRS